jgi:hypothetical protein
LKDLERTIKTYDEVAELQTERTRDRSGLAREQDRFRGLLPDGALVLDIGGGSGADSDQLRRRGLQVITCDLSFGMLEAGRKLFPGPRVQTDMRSLPFDSGVQGCWVNASMLHLDRAEVSDALRGFRQVMVSPAILHVAVKLGDDQAWDTRYGADRPRWFTYWRPEQLDRELTDAGFRIIEGDIQQGSVWNWISRLCCSVP